MQKNCAKMAKMSNIEKNRKLRIKVGEQSVIEISCRGTICNRIVAKTDLMVMCRGVMCQVEKGGIGAEKLKSSLSDYKLYTVAVINF